MSTGIIDIIKRVALNAYEATQPVGLYFGKVISTNPVKIQVGEHLTLPQEFLVINGTVFEGDEVSLIRCQGGQKYVVLGTRVGYVENTVYAGGGELLPDGTMTIASGGYQLPFKNGYTVTSAFGVNRGSSKHKGTDMVGSGSKHIYSINNGTVVEVAYDGDGYGNYIIVNHGDGYWSLYGHLSKTYVKEGQGVNKNTILGVEGSTGRSTGSHLHLEIRKGSNSNSSAINPMTFLQNN